MARTGGNPDLKKYQYTTDNEEPNKHPINVKVPKSMFNKLDERFGDKKNDFIREAIAKALNELEKSA
jgi:hypothetical protein